MKDTNGKVILSLLAGATAGIVAGLLLAPETGDQTRAGLKESASKWGGDLSKLLKDGLAKLNDLKGDAAAGSDQTQQSRSAADDLLNSMNSGQDTDYAGSVDRADHNTDYDGIGNDARHTGDSGYGRTL
ncbi:YtxH domain-containing protein [Hymenobacter persicinus]|uniref:YtxH domain-containing protein n=1 Tax=Hymenobacter persicinus TaxID=2025506 RepID=A0A4Q5L9M9_9BACT|nr:YtxH domain-containing protein [Hymenobacter persicinus]RYU77752.1 YtxH domain-containing protein [Hymenobacter persicinus]